MSLYTKRVLDVGQCGFDHPRIKQKIESTFGASVDRAHTAAETLDLAQQTSYDLIMVNRILDADGDSGLELIKSLKKNSAASSTQVMLISNYSDAQREAIQAGAVQGFGKNAINAAETKKVLTELLSG